MKSHRKKEKTMVTEGSDETAQAFLSVLAESIFEETKEQGKDLADPFEKYAHSLREKVHADQTTFHTRFVRGYGALLEELAHEHEEQDKRKSSGRSNL